MKHFILVTLFLSVHATLCHAGSVDTVDIWTIKINDDIVVRTNLTEIQFGKPMRLSLHGYKDSDTVKIEHWTDSGLERWAWAYVFEGENHTFIDRYENDIDSSIHCLPEPCTTYSFHKPYIAFTVGQLRKLLHGGRMQHMQVLFEPPGATYGSKHAYTNKPVCVISP